jgi:hypothetical protein
MLKALGSSPGPRNENKNKNKNVFTSEPKLFSNLILEQLLQVLQYEELSTLNSFSLTCQPT